MTQLFVGSLPHEASAVFDRLEVLLGPQAVGSELSPSPYPLSTKLLRPMIDPYALPTPLLVEPPLHDQ